jgi:hypothetical protein
VISRLQLACAPQGLEVAVAEGADATRRGLASRELDQLIETLLPSQTVVRLAEGRPVVRGRDDLHLSLSHAVGATALAVAPFRVGVDIECVDSGLDALAIDPELFGRSCSAGAILRFCRGRPRRSGRRTSTGCGP